MVSLDKQIASKELIKLQQQTEKAFDTDFMKQLAQNSRTMAEVTEKSGLRSQFEQLHKQIVAVAPEMFRDITVEQPPATPEPEPEPLTDKEIYLEAKEKFQYLAQNFHGEHFDFGSIWECADEMRKRTNQLEYDSYSDAYRFAVKHYTANGKPIKDIGSLENEFAKAKHKGRSLISVTDQFK